MAWTPQDYEDAKKAQAANPHPEFAAAIEEYENTHGVGMRRGPTPSATAEQLAQQQPFEISPGVPPRDEKLIAEARAGQQRATTLRPPEHLVQRPPSAIDPLVNPIMAVYDYLPSYVGGGTEMWAEPSLAQFREQGAGL
jgi:hypothetical protein